MGLFETLRDWGHAFNYTGFGIDPLRQGTPSGITAGSATGFIPTVGGARAVPNRAYASFIGTGKYSFRINTHSILVTGMMEQHKYLMKDDGKVFMQQALHGM
jgi:hypothetical protein